MGCHSPRNQGKVREKFFMKKSGRKVRSIL